MTIGIYSLYWESCGLTYIGQSVEVETRWSAHRRLLLRKQHYNWKIQSTYDKYGDPEYLLLQESQEPSLDALEKFWVSSVPEFFLLNIQEPGTQTGSGTKNPNSKHSTIKILRIFIYLYKYGYSQPKVSRLTKVPRGTISHIACGKAHKWLQAFWPQEYKAMLSNAKYNIETKESA